MIHLNAAGPGSRHGDPWLPPDVGDVGAPDRHGHEYPGRRRIEADLMQCDTAGAEELRPARAADDRARNA